MNTQKKPSFRKIISLLLAVLLLLGAAPLTAFAEEEVWVENESQLFAAMAENSTVNIHFSENIRLSKPLVIGNGNANRVSIDLNDNRLFRTLENTAADGYVIYIASGAQLDLTSGLGNSMLSVVTGGKATTGGGVYNNGTFNFYSGSISGNTASGEGGGVYNNGTMNMYGGVIVYNTAGSNGGGIKNNGVLNIRGGMIRQNDASYGGGIHSGSSGQNDNGRVVDIRGATLEGNSATYTGGGITAHTYTQIADCIINQNTAGTDGGGVHVNTMDGTVSFLRTKITENTAQNGAGVNVYYAPYATEFNRCDILNNTASQSGGGIQCICATNLLDTEVSGNSAASRGGGVYVNGKRLGVAGATQVSQNGTQNVYLNNGQKIQVNGYLEANADIGITYASSTGTVSKDYGANMGAADPNDYFFADVDVRRVDKGCLTLLNGEIRYDITGFSDYPPEQSYTYTVKVRTTNDADGWNHALCTGYVTDGYNGFGGGSTKVFEHYFESDIDDEGEETTFSFTSEHFLDKLNFYFDIGGGFTWHSWEGDMTLYINGNNTGSDHYVASSSPFSSSNASYDFRISSDKMPYPETVFFNDGTDARTLVYSDEEYYNHATGESAVSGMIYCYAVDQYNTVWKNPDISIQSNVYPDKEGIYTDRDTGSGMREVKQYNYFYQSRKIYSRVGIDHTSTFTAVYPTKNILHPKEQFKFKASFETNKTVRVVVDETEVWYTRGKVGETVTLPPLTAPTGYDIVDFDQDGNGDVEILKDGDTITGFLYTFGETDETLTAILQAHAYTIAYDGNGSTSGKMNDQYTKYGTALKLTGCRFRKEGYSFVGWNTKPDGSGTAYQNRAIVKNLTDKQGETVTLYAQWAQDVFTVTLQYPEEIGREDEVFYVTYRQSVKCDTVINTSDSENHFVFDGSSEPLDDITEDITIELYYKRVEHTFGNETVEKALTCFEAGQTSAVCSECGYVRYTTIPCLGHMRPVVTNYQPASCTTPGSTGSIFCYACMQTVQTAEVIPALGHDLDTENATWNISTDTGVLKGSVSVVCKHNSSHIFTAELSFEQVEQTIVAKAEIEGTLLSKELKIGKDIYTVTVETPEHGTLSASHEFAFAGDSVSLQGIPESDEYVLYRMDVLRPTGSAVAISHDNVFTMPRSNVTVSAVFDVVHPNQCGPDLYWEYTAETKTLRIFGEGKMFDYDFSLKGSPLWNRKKVEHVIIEEGATSIGAWAFANNNNLKSIQLPDSLLRIESNAFQDSYYNLKEITLPENLQYIGRAAFRGLSNLSVFSIPASVSYIGIDAFKECSMENIYSFADPEKLTWDDGYLDDFLPGRRTTLHVSPEWLGSYKSKFENVVNVSFAGDLKLYNISVETVQNGSLQADATAAREGQCVKLSAVPDSGYALKSLSVRDASGKSVAVNEGSFLMPASDVTLSAEFEKPENSINLTVGNDITSNYYIDYASYLDAATVTYTYNSVNETEENVPLTKSIDLSAIDASVLEGDKIKLTVSQAPAQLAETTHIEILSKTGEVLDALDYSAKAYCDKVIHTGEEVLAQFTGSVRKSEQLKTLCHSLIAYAEAAQGVFKDYQTTAVVCESDAVKEQIAAAGAVPLYSLKNSGMIRFTTVSFACKKDARLRFYLDTSGATSTPPAPSASKGTAALKYTDESGSRKYFIEVSGINAADFDKKITVSYGGSSIEFSVLDYCGIVLKDGSTASNAIRQLAKTLIVYYQNAQAYSG